MLYSLLKLSAKDIATQQSKTTVLQTLVCLSILEENLAL